MQRGGEEERGAEGGDPGEVVQAEGCRVEEEREEF